MSDAVMSLLRRSAPQKLDLIGLMHGIALGFQCT